MCHLISSIWLNNIQTWEVILTHVESEKQRHVLFKQTNYKAAFKFISFSRCFADMRTSLVKETWAAAVGDNMHWGNPRVSVRVLVWASQLAAESRTVSGDTSFCVRTEVSYFRPRLKSPSSPSSMLSHWYRQASEDRRQHWNLWAENTIRFSRVSQVPGLKMQIQFQSHMFKGTKWNQRRHWWRQEDEFLCSTAGTDLSYSTFDG